SHFALKKLNNFKEQELDKKQYFTVLPNIKISQDARKCLVVEAPYVSDEKIVTNDIVDIQSDSEFEWIGRFDNIVNTGGVKVYPEQIENKLAGKIKQRYIVASRPDEVLGERLILVVEDEANEINESVFDGLEKFEKPKEVFTLKEFVQTGFGKIHRKETLALLNL